MSPFRRSRVLRAPAAAQVQSLPLRARGAPFAAPAAPGRTSEVSAERLAELERAAAEASRQAYQRGLREGEAAARARAEQPYQEQAAALARAAQELVASRADVLRRAELDVLRLSVQIARRVLHREVSVDAASLEALVRVALDKVQAAELLRIRAHPDHAAVVRTCLERGGAPPRVEVVADAGLPRGGTIFEMQRGNLDASLDTQLQEIERGLIDRFENRVHERVA